jgi:hypothetical protein
MDIRVIKSLTTCALYPYLEGRKSGSDAHDGLDQPNGAEFPDAVAYSVLHLPEAGGAITHQAVDFFISGFDFALEVAAAITDDPSHSPNLSAAIANTKARIAQALDGAA